jgi:ABC-type transporter Mla maintaining outer membrane lipid asymmetry ATPase subunit MlaF
MTGVGITVGRKVFPAQGGAPARLLFDNLDLALAPGEVCAVVGPRAWGKLPFFRSRRVSIVPTTAR